MKMTKKIVLGALAAMALVFSGCDALNTLGGDPNAEDSVNGTIINGFTSKAYVGAKDGDGYTNTNSATAGKTGTVREMQLFATKHYGAFGALTLTGEDKNATQGNGQLGYVFNLTENTDKTVNFITIGFRWNNKKLETYVSQYYNVKTNEFSENNFGVSDDGSTSTKSGEGVNKYVATKTTGYECIIKDLGTVLPADKFGTLDNDGTATIGVNVIAEDDGTYTIKYYGPTKLDNNYKLKKNQEADMTITVPADVLDGRTTKKQTKMGCYAAVYAGKTLNGFWRFSDIKGEDVPVEE